MPKKSVFEVFEIPVGGVNVHVRLAVTLPEMQRGLMERKQLPDDAGMLFVYDAPQAMHFWMKNTPLALDVGFFDADGVLREVHPMYPFDENTVSSTGDQLLYALEMNQGWFARHGVMPGKARLDAKRLGDALVARGISPEKRGLRQTE